MIQSPGDSQSLNPYSYIMNNPLAGTDPTGYTACGEGPQGCVGEFSPAFNFDTDKPKKDPNSVCNDRTTCKIIDYGKMSKDAAKKAQKESSKTGKQGDRAQQTKTTTKEPEAVDPTNLNPIKKDKDDPGYPIYYKDLTEAQQKAAMEALSDGKKATVLFRDALSDRDDWALKQLSDWTGIGSKEEKWIISMIATLDGAINTMNTWIAKPSSMIWHRKLGIYTAFVPDEGSQSRRGSGSPVYLNPPFWGGSRSSRSETLIHEALHYNSVDHNYKKVDYIGFDDARRLARRATDNPGKNRIRAVRNNYVITSIIVNREY